MHAKKVNSKCTEEHMDGAIKTNYELVTWFNESIWSVF